MKKNLLLTTTCFLIMIVPISLFGQGFKGAGTDNIRSDKGLDFSKDYLSYCQSNNDTLWLPTNLDYYLWNGTDLQHDDLAYVLDYYNNGAMKSLITYNANTQDSTIKFVYEYDQDNKKISEKGYDFSKNSMAWVLRYKALFYYDQYNQIDTTLVKAWDHNLQLFKDSIAQSYVRIDTFDIVQETICKYLENGWDTVYSYKWVNYRNSNFGLDSTRSFIFNSFGNTWSNHGRIVYRLNDKNEPEEFYWYKWSVDTNDQYYWENDFHYVDVKWENFRKSIFNYYSRISSRYVYRWYNNSFYTFTIDTVHYFEHGDTDIYQYTLYFPEGDTIGIPFVWNKSCTDNYANGKKRRFRQFNREEYNQPLRLSIDDSITYTYYMGSLEELYRVEYDTAKKVWHPAARALYTNFVPFVNTSTGLQQIKTNNEKLVIKPNPANQSVTIESNGEIESISIYSLEGRLVKEWSVSNPQSSIMLDINDLPIGTYIIDANIRKKHRATAKLMVR